MNEQSMIQWLSLALLMFIALTVGLAVFGGGF
jgi:hypothetical protein